MEPDNALLLEAIEVAAGGSASLVAWALAIFGGSVAAVVSTSYLRPRSLLVRQIYLLFLPGWLFVGISIFYGDRISRRLTAAHFVDPAGIRPIAERINADYFAQRNMLMVGLACFTVWLVLYLLWWIYERAEPQRRPE